MPGLRIIIMQSTLKSRSRDVGNALNDSLTLLLFTNRLVLPAGCARLRVAGCTENNRALNSGKVTAGFYVLSFMHTRHCLTVPFLGHIVTQMRPLKFLSGDNRLWLLRTTVHWNEGLRSGSLQVFTKVLLFYRCFGIIG